MKICVLVKEVPDAAVEKRIDPSTGRMDRSGEKNLNPYDTHAIEAAMQIKEGGAVEVDEIVAVTMGPDSASARAAQGRLARRRPLRAPVRRRARRLRRGRHRLRAGQGARAGAPDLVLLGQQSDDGECYTIGAVVADHLQMPSLTQVIKMDVAEGKLTCERQAEYGYDTVEVELPAVISVGDAINEPRYPSLKAIMGAKKKPLEDGRRRRRRHRRRAGRRRGLARRVRRLPGSAGEVRRRDHRGRGHQRDGREDRRLARRKEADLDERHPGLRPPLRGRVQQELPRRRLRGRPPGRRARRRVPRDRRRRRRPDRRPLRPRSATTARTKVFRAKGARGPGPAGRRRDGQGHRATAATTTRCSAAACSASRSAPAWPRA